MEPLIHQFASAIVPASGRTCTVGFGQVAPASFDQVKYS